MPFSKSEGLTDVVHILEFLWLIIATGFMWAASTSISGHETYMRLKFNVECNVRDIIHDFKNVSLSNEFQDDDGKMQPITYVFIAAIACMVLGLFRSTSAGKVMAQWVPTTFFNWFAMGLFSVVWMMSLSKLASTGCSDDPQDEIHDEPEHIYAYNIFMTAILAWLLSFVFMFVGKFTAVNETAPRMEYTQLNSKSHKKMYYRVSQMIDRFFQFIYKIVDPTQQMFYLAIGIVYVYIATNDPSFLSFVHQDPENFTAAAEYELFDYRIEDTADFPIAFRDKAYTNESCFEHVFGELHVDGEYYTHFATTQAGECLAGYVNETAGVSTSATSANDDYAVSTFTILRNRTLGQNSVHNASHQFSCHKDFHDNDMNVKKVLKPAAWVIIAMSSVLLIERIVFWVWMSDSDWYKNNKNKTMLSFLESLLYIVLVLAFVIAVFTFSSANLKTQCPVFNVLTDRHRRIAAYSVFLIGTTVFFQGFKLVQKLHHVGVIPAEYSETSKSSQNSELA